METKNEGARPLRIGDIVEGKVVGAGRAAVYLDLSPIGTGVIYGREFYAEKDAIKDLKIGDKIFCKVIDLENEDGYIELSLRQAGREINWKKLEQMKEEKEMVKVTIEKANKGGLVANMFGIPAFLPVSQLSLEHYPRVEGGDPAKILQELQKLIGQEISVMIFDLDKREEKLILSEKATRAPKIKELISKYKVGDIIEGEITGVVDFGAFIHFPKDSLEEERLEGLIHISELDWQLIGNPSEIVKVGDVVKAKIISITDEDRILLSLKALKQDPWEGLENKLKKGEEISGKVIKFNLFGVFVEIFPKIQGLCHISEFVTEDKMRELLEIGKEYKFEVLDINPQDHKLLLKLKAPQ